MATDNTETFSGLELIEAAANALREKRITDAEAKTLSGVSAKVMLGQTPTKKEASEYNAVLDKLRGDLVKIKAAAKTIS